MSILQIIGIWFLVSIIFSLALGSFLSLTSPPQDDVEEDDICKEQADKVSRIA